MGICHGKMNEEKKRGKMIATMFSYIAVSPFPEN